MIEKWNQFVYDLCDAKKRNVDENEYHRLIELQFQLLGWARYRGEICHKPNIPIGNNNFIQPDILIKKDDDELFVIEVKRPMHILSIREKQQLESYMRQRKIKVGIYIGEHIELFYDKPTWTDTISVLKIELELDNKFGEVFVELFSKDNFSKDKLFEYCESRVTKLIKQEEIDKAKEHIINNAHEIVSDCLAQYLKTDYETSFSEDEIKSILSELIITIKPKQNIITIQNQIPLVNDSNCLPSNIEPKPTEKPAKYSLNGGPFLAANRFVLEVVRCYVKLHPELTYTELESIFPSDLQGSSGVIRTLEYLRIKNYKGQRFFEDRNSIIRSADNVEFAVCTQWSYHNMHNFTDYAKKLGFSVEKKQ